MKKTWMTGLAALAFLCGCCTETAVPQKDGNDGIDCMDCKARIAERLELQLPPVIYAVPGVEMNVYFANLVLAVNPGNYVFDVDCPKGRNDEKRWRFTPKESDVGTYDWKVSVINELGTIATASCKLIVSPANAGEGRKITILMIGDSLTGQNYYPQALAANLKRPGNPEAKFIGSSGTKEVRHEGHGGWRWEHFLKENKPTVSWKNGKKRVHPIVSPFRFDGKFDFASYLKKYNKGKAPDFIMIQLGTNNVFRSTDANIGQRIEQVLASADQMLSGLRKAAPDAVIGVSLLPPCAASQDAFGNRYRCSVIRWQFRKNQHRMNAAMLKKFADYPDKKVFLLPACLNLDTEHNYPETREPVSANEEQTQVSRQSDGVHPAPAGYRQLGDCAYCWLKFQLSDAADKRQ